MSLMMNILRDLTPLNRVMCSTDYDRTVEYLRGLFEFEVLGYPAFAEHNNYVLRELLGLSAEEIAVLEREGVTGSTPDWSVRG